MDRTSFFYRHRLSIIVFIILSILCIFFGFVLNQYYASQSGAIVTLSGVDIISNAEIESYGLSQLLTQTINSIKTNLRLIVDAPSIQNMATDAKQLLNTAQLTTSNITDFYMWLDNGGKIVWISNFNESAYQKYRGTNLDYREYFSSPKKTHQPYYSDIIDSNDGIPRLYISYPIMNSKNEVQSNTINSSLLSSSKNQFKGIITAAIRIDSIGEFLQRSIPAKYDGTVGLVNNEGVILHTTNTSLIGTNLFGQEFQSLLPSSFKEQFNKLINKSLAKGNTGGVETISYLGNTTSFAYHPILLGDHQLGTLYISVPHVLAQNVKTLTDQQRLVTIIIYVVIGSIAVGIAVVMLTWNRRLQHMVNNKTGELKKTNEELKTANENLKNIVKCSKNLSI
jgi:hypothetical protein